LKKDGSVRAVAVIDASDAAWVNQWHWVWDGRYLSRSFPVGSTWKNVRLHRALLGLAPGDRMREVDHIDRDTLNNRRSNLRVVRHGGNMQNMPAVRGSSSRYRGVHWSTKRNAWVAQVSARNRRVYVGQFSDEAEAAEAARRARAQLLPFAVD
jgi:hypothetical protein